MEQSNEEFDISSEEVVDTGIVEIEKPNGDPMIGTGGKQVSVTVWGPGSKQYSRAQAKRNRAVVEAVRRGAKKMKDDEQREVDATFLADCTASFNNFKYLNLEGYDAFKALYMNPKLGFVAEQVNRKLGDWSGFTKQAATS